MTSSIRATIKEIHAAPQMAVVAVTGAGSRAIAWLLEVAGASRTLLEAVVPYGRRSVVDFLGHEPARFVSPRTARDIAQVAYRLALNLREGSPPVVGLACTATIATDRPKRGEHWCCVATWYNAGVTTYTLRLAKGQRDRGGEEEVVSLLVIYALARACGIDVELPLGLINGERLEVQSRSHASPIKRLLSGETSTVTVYSDARMGVDEPLLVGALLPGAFSPLHHGHEQLARVASEILGTEVVFELSVVNVDKPPLKEAEVRRRLRQFEGKGRVILTRSETFRKKAGLFPGCTFVIGWDTALRLLDPRYYGGEEQAMFSAVAEIGDAGCRFLVAGREHDGEFRSLAQVPIPHGLIGLFHAIPESRFRADISSTNLRSNPRG